MLISDQAKAKSNHLLIMYTDLEQKGLPMDRYFCCFSKLFFFLNEAFSDL